MYGWRRLVKNLWDTPPKCFTHFLEKSFILSENILKTGKRLNIDWLSKIYLVEFISYTFVLNITKASKFIKIKKVYWMKTKNSISKKGLPRSQTIIIYYYSYIHISTFYMIWTRNKGSINLTRLFLWNIFYYIIKWSAYLSKCILIQLRICSASLSQLQKHTQNVL